MSDFDYKGTLPLDYKLFPEHEYTVMDEEGYEWAQTSNILTQYRKNPDTGKYILYPTMKGGLDIGSEGGWAGALKGKHFGIYDTKDEAKEADILIHGYFKSLKEALPIEDKVIDHLKKQ